jgi:hypothetical protein
MIESVGVQISMELRHRSSIHENFGSIMQNKYIENIKKKSRKISRIQRDA